MQRKSSTRGARREGESLVPGPGCFECQDITSSKLVGLRRFFEHGAQKDALHLRTFTHARALRICLHPPFARHYNLPAVCAWLKDASLWATHEPLWSGGLSLFRKARACLWRDGYTRFSFRLCIVLGAILQANLFSRCQSSSKDHWSLVRLYGRRVVHRNLRSRVWAAQCHGVGLCKCRLQICGAAARPHFIDLTCTCWFGSTPHHAMWSSLVSSTGRSGHVCCAPAFA